MTPGIHQKHCVHYTAKQPWMGNPSDDVMELLFDVANQLTPSSQQQ
jgi:hypothetical protein